MKFFWGIVALLLIKPILWLGKGLWWILSFFVQLLFLKAIFKLID
ncbi:hypothetical protein SORDD17_01065 [Streptococcus oralis]|uniref:Uncharacterized protein n=1 Tax=Streptococcus oralis TaxID=1303 RepID=A0A139RL19_STROR|nr:hypothetical protein SORDD17_01065 [Streptococcus oralis]